MDKQIGEANKMVDIENCPHCKHAWLYVSDGDYYSGYESKGYRINCFCGYAWKSITWHNTKEKAIEEWNRRVNNG